MKPKTMWAVKFENQYFTYATKDMALHALDLIQYKTGFGFDLEKTYICRVEVKEVVKNKSPKGRKKEV